MTRNHAHFVRWILIAAIVWGAICTNQVRGVQLEWNPTGEAGVAGYRVYIGNTSRAYTSSIDVGNATSFPLDSLDAGQTYFFAVTAYDVDRIESDYSDEATYTVLGTRPPVGTGDSFAIGKNGVLNISASSGVLANDYDPDGSAIEATLVSSAANGSVTLNASGAFTYQPATDFVGTDNFTYRASDGSMFSEVVTVTINVTNIVVIPVNHAPVAVANQYVTGKNTSLVVSDASGVLANDSDLDADVLQAVTIAGPTHGQLVLDPWGGFTYTPATGYVGSDSFTYRASDGLLNSAATTVSITITNINRLPVATGEQYATAKNTKLTVGAAAGVLVNDSDPDGDALTAVLVTAPAHGQLTLGASGNFSYTPASTYAGDDSFVYRVSDGTANSGLATATITITNIPPANRAPTAGADQYAVEKNKVLTIANGVLANDSDLDGNSLTAVLISLPAHGGVNLAANGSFTYTPVTGFVGTDNFTYRAFDGLATSAVATVTISITNSPIVATNRTPIAMPDSYVVLQNTRLDVSIESGVLTNDYDPEAIAAAVIRGPAHGQLTFDATGAFSFTPAQDFVGSDSFSYRVTDGALFSTPATVNLTIVATNVVTINHAPVAGAEQYSGMKDTLLTVPAAKGVLINDSDPDGDAIEPVLVALPAHGSLSVFNNGGFLYMPASGFVGVDRFSYRASDGMAVSDVAQVTISVSNSVTAATNRPPIAIGDLYTLQGDHTLYRDIAHGVLVNDRDNDGDAITAELVSLPAHGTVSLSSDGSFRFTPTTGFVGSDSFAYRASDGRAVSPIVTVLLTVTNPPASTELTCADCIAELNSLVASQERRATPLFEISTSNSISEAVHAFSSAAKSMRGQGPETDAELRSVGTCLVTVLSNSIANHRREVQGMYPSPWSAAAVKLLSTLEESQDGSDTIRTLPVAVGILKRLDLAIVRGNVVPESLEKHTISLALTATTGGRSLVHFENGTFSMERDGSVRTGSYAFSQSAWDQGTVVLNFVSAPAVTLQLQFRSNGQGRVRGPIAKGTFVVVE